MVKEPLISQAQKIFEATGVQITTEGCRLLGAPLGTDAFCQSFLQDKVSSWTSQLSTLATVARTQPHAAYTAFTKAFVGRLVFIAHCVPNVSSFLAPVEEAILSKFLPSLTGRSSPSDDVRALLALPPRLGGLGIINPTASLKEEYAHSKSVCAPLTALILEQRSSLGNVCDIVIRNKDEASCHRRKALAATASTTKLALSPSLQRAVDVCSERGASHWLLALPLDQHGFSLSKGSFRDALCLRYGWRPDHLPTQCVCGKPFDVDHALSCSRGGYTILRHNELRDVTASLLSEVCHDVQVEPPLIPLSGETLLGRSANASDEARLDIGARGFWNDRFSRTLFDVRVFHPNAMSAQATALSSQYAKHERLKRREYEERVREVEGASFVPMIFSTAGGMGPAATITFKRLANLLSEKLDVSYSGMINFIRCRLSFALLRSAITAMRGSRRPIRRVCDLQPALAIAESGLNNLA